MRTHISSVGRAGPGGRPEQQQARQVRAGQAREAAGRQQAEADRRRVQQPLADERADREQHVGCREERRGQQPRGDDQAPARAPPPAAGRRRGCRRCLRRGVLWRRACRPARQARRPQRLQHGLRACGRRAARRSRAATLLAGGAPVRARPARRPAAAARRHTNTGCSPSHAASGPCSSRAYRAAGTRYQCILPRGREAPSMHKPIAAAT